MYAERTALALNFRGLIKLIILCGRFIPKPYKEDFLWKNYVQRKFWTKKFVLTV